ncbi:hypothetical protein NDU88_008311 [Pleurodeles waltl]|uniref:Uncharacterized protein n=1 Tax=Pleurodeles waltl TaxID=8319 RepID=A0AAV7NW74_PLEWA|nr:hypothetical protein NDU88_008311 [Pleurodeles waltl]
MRRKRQSLGGVSQSSEAVRWGALLSPRPGPNQGRLRLAAGERGRGSCQAPGGEGGAAVLRPKKGAGPGRGPREVESCASLPTAWAKPGQIEIGSRGEGQRLRPQVEKVVQRCFGRRKKLGRAEDHERWSLVLLSPRTGLQLILEATRQPVAVGESSRGPRWAPRGQVIEQHPRRNKEPVLAEAGRMRHAVCKREPDELRVEGRL